VVTELPGVCPTCKRTYEEGIRFCLECGTPLQGLETSKINRQEESTVLQAKDQTIVEEREDVRPQPQDETDAIRSILKELTSSVKSLQASLNVVSDTNLLLLKKLYELDSILEKS
jgi:hypothetical protein